MKMGKRLLCWLMCAMMLLTAAAPALAEETTLQLMFQGLRARSDGTWASESLSGVFTVMQGDEVVGIIIAAPQGGSPLTLSSIGMLRLIPDLSTMPEGYECEENGYTVAVSPGIANTAAVLLYAQAGLFTVQAEAGAAFLLLDAEGVEALSFVTDETGFYALPEAITAGVYTLRQTSGAEPMEDKVFELPVYTGSANQIVAIDAAFESHPELLTAAQPMAEPTEVPTAAPTEAPTIVPTAVPTAEPTAEPTAVSTTEPTEAPTDEPTVEPTAEPTTEPTEVPTTEPTEAPTDEPTVEPTAEPTAVPTEAPTANPTEAPTDEPTVEPTAEPTAEPTEVPTAEPAEVTAMQPGTLRLENTGDAAATYTLERDGDMVASGTLEGKQSIVTDALEAGTYIFTLGMGEGVMLASLNGQFTEQFGQAQWQVVVTEGEESLYQLEVVTTAMLGVCIKGVPEAEVTIYGVRGEKTVMVPEAPGNEDFYITGIYVPDVEPYYECVVTVKLPAGVYRNVLEDEIWETEPNDEGGVTITHSHVVFERGHWTGIGLYKRVTYADVSGSLTTVDGSPFTGATVQLLRTNGVARMETTTDANGDWRLEQVENGDYILSVPDLGGLGANDRYITVTDDGLTDVRIIAAATGSLTVSAFEDKSDNGSRGAYEGFLSYVFVDVYAAGDEPMLVARGVTDAEANQYGAAIFENLPAGEYFIVTTVPEGYGYSKHQNGYRTLDNIMQTSTERVQASEVFPVEAGKMRYIGVGALPLSSISGVVWSDVDGDGIYQDGEPGQPGVTLTLTHKNGTVYTTESGEDGSFLFDNILYGSYKLTFTLPADKMFTNAAPQNTRRSLLTAAGQSSGTVSMYLNPGDRVDGQYVGVISGSNITGRCFLDANYNGLLDEGEAPLPGVTLTLTRNGSGNALATVTSGEDGSFVFSGLRGGSYAVAANLPDDGSVYTLVTGGGNQFAARSGRKSQTVGNLELADNGTLSLTLGAVYPATISGVAYLDDNFSGAMEDGEQAVNNLTVALLDASGNQIASTRTGKDGSFAFTGVMPGSYRLSLSALAGYAFTKTGEGSVVVNTGNGTGLSELFDAPIGQTVSGRNIGMILPGVVEGVVFGDLNDNGVQDEGEPGLTGAVVRLIETTEGEAFSAVIGDDGAYRFDAVMPGRYYLRFELPEGGVFSSVTGVQHDGGVGESEVFSFATGAHVTGPVCGGIALGGIDGVVFDDRNANGVQDEGEAAMQGVTITLTPDRGELEAVTVVTGADGCFAIGDLRPGSYQLTLAYPEGYVSSRLSGVTLPVASGYAAQTVALTVPMGGWWHDQMLGGVRPASLSGQIWLDENNNGLRDPGEATPAGERVTVIDQLTGETFAVLTTDEAGVFATSGLVPGSYTVSYALSDSIIAPKSGDSTFTQEGGQLVMRDLAAVEGDTVDGLVLGVVKLTSISGAVWHDNGTRIEGLWGAQVTLMDGEGNVISKTDTNSGSYAFTGLLPGDYQLGVLLPEGQVVVEPGDERLGEGGQVSVMTTCRNREATSDVFTLRMGENATGMDIGSVLPSRLGDRVWLDENGNGLQDMDEGGIPGVLIELIRDGEVVESTTSDEYGFYFFQSIYPATYTLRVTAPDTIRPTTLRTDYPAAASILTETGESVPVTVASDSRNYNADLGFVLVTPGVYPAGYGEGTQQDWTHIGW